MGSRFVGTAWMLIAVACSASPQAQPTKATVAPAEVLTEPSVLVPDEQGFVDVPPRRDTPTPARMFYVFQHAAVPGAPLVMLANGGPGYATTFGLLAYGTSRYSVALDRGTNTAHVEPTAGPWTSFANLLYVDEREVGFSYGVRDRASPPPLHCGMDSRSDAADFVRVVLEFLDTHPALRAAPVVLAGESYAGTRVSYMLDLLLHYRDEAPLVDDTLADRIQRHYDAVFPESAGELFAPTRIAQQFGTQVLIEPFLGGAAQLSLTDTLLPSDPDLSPYVDGTRDPLDVRRPGGWSDALDDATAAVFASPDAGALLVGGDMTRVLGMRPADRLDGFRPPGEQRPSVDALDVALAARMGALPPPDSYFAQYTSACHWSQLDSVDGAFAPFIDNLRYVRTFITRARYDAVVYSPCIPDMLSLAGLGGVVDDAPRDGVARPGWFDVQLTASSDGTQPATIVTVRFPEYEAGHMVALDQSRALRDDIAAWLFE